MVSAVTCGAVMAFDRNIWIEKFLENSVPSFPCPHCSRGVLGFDGKSFWKEEPKHSKDAHAHDDWDPTWIEERFVMFLRCGVAKCGEVVAVSGNIEVEEVVDEDEGYDFASVLYPTSLVPAPPIIQMTDGTPDEVAGELSLAFQLFWADLGASATKIRTSVERLMDHFKVARYSRTKGKLKPIPLYNRIEAFIKANGKVVHQDHLHALRVVGNLGTHKNSLTRSDILEAFQVYEHALDELIGKKSASIAKLARKLKKK
ncbi:hypothetical protein I8G32_02902 [Rhodopseudomonas palustris]|nr:DUF4145 domain-containing protein [Rhodopseudomonas palustris]QQM04347.1 hypothetical protein I8G32_02902 [Rhodopseudomonas palustris]RJF66009.1 DUF4145 domain-containing protein [Rhodopseudomonas palustris]WAB75734.1 DUF4145 domain-containing protein [Rhodopseudomonas palustris]WCL92983.1 DUF4145 domain-containing protein [Rhodopseudomonas palustris CGA009]WND49644.1 DUF4145 domain-containing protein [Rhodopseudomonas palustris]